MVRRSICVSCKLEFKVPKATGRKPLRCAACSRRQALLKAEYSRQLGKLREVKAKLIAESEREIGVSAKPKNKGSVRGRKGMGV